MPYVRLKGITRQTKKWYVQLKAEPNFSPDPHTGVAILFLFLFAQIVEWDPDDLTKLAEMYEQRQRARAAPARTADEEKSSA